MPSSSGFSSFCCQSLPPRHTLASSDELGFPFSISVSKVFFVCQTKTYLTSSSYGLSDRQKFDSIEVHPEEKLSVLGLLGMSKGLQVVCVTLKQLHWKACLWHG